MNPPFYGSYVKVAAEVQPFWSKISKTTKKLVEQLKAKYDMIPAVLDGMLDDKNEKHFELLT